MVLRLYLFKRCFLWVFILYHWAQRKRLHPFIHLYITRQSRLPYGAIHRLLHHCLLVLLVFLHDDPVPFWGLLHSRSHDCSNPLLYLLYFILHTRPPHYRTTSKFPNGQHCFFNLIFYHACPRGCTDDPSRTNLCFH